MKKNLLILLTVLVTTLSFSQRNERREEIKALKIAFITERLDLTQTQAQEFWPIYNKFEESYNELRKSIYHQRKRFDVESSTEQEAKDLLATFTDMEKQKFQLKQAMVSDLSEVISAKQIIQLKKAEDDFNRRMIEEFKKRRQERRDKKP